MVQRPRDASEAEAEALHEMRIRKLRVLAAELQIPPAAAETLIEDVLHSAMLMKPGLDVDRWLATSLRRAAKRLAEGGDA